MESGHRGPQCSCLWLWLLLWPAGWAGVAGLSALGMMLFLPAYPFWALTILAVDIVAIYGRAATAAAWCLVTVPLSRLAQDRPVRAQSLVRRVVASALAPRHAHRVRGI